MRIISTTGDEVLNHIHTNSIGESVCKQYPAIYKGTAALRQCNKTSVSIEYFPPNPIQSLVGVVSTTVLANIKRQPEHNIQR